MTKLFRSTLVFGVVLAASAVGFAQAGDATYKSKCASCHGATGTPSAGMAKLMGMKPASDPEMQKLTIEQISTAVKAGKGKMKPVAGLTDEQVKEVATFFKGLK